LTSPVSSPSQIGGAPKGQDLDLRYQKNEQVGAGPLGTVYKGKHNALGLDVCVKELKDIFGYFSFLQRGEVIKRLKKELCSQAQVRHPGIVAVLDQNTDVARPYFVMELLKGSLREKLDQAGNKGLPVPQAMRWFLQLAYALRSAHQSGLTHHNIKPENVLFDQWGNAKLGDFGLSRVIEVDQSKGMPQVFVGTGGMGYMSPELIARSKDAGPSSDVYGLGILLYEMLTGQIPGRRSPLPSEINSDVPTKIDPIFDKMTQDRKDSRYPDFEAVFEDFYAAFADKTYLGKGDLLLWSEPQQG
ncbi:MAG TPA: serine/threonine-protein kinase, partial [Archangium sp.]